MAENKTFPNIPVTHWYKLRAQLKRSIPGTMTSNYIASVLGMTETSAKANVIPSLRMVGLIDENDKTNQDLAKKFRDDGQYKTFCSSLLKSIYPEEVLDAFPDSSSNKEGIKTWFMNHSGIGSSAASRISSFALLEANLDYEIKPTTSSSSGTKKIKPNETKNQSTSSSKTSIKKEEDSDSKSKTNNYPELNINIQIHISSDATPDQIEKIFESMSKHIYKNK